MVDIPVWLKTEDEYLPGKDHDAFLDKSIFSLLKMLSRIKKQDTVQRATHEANAAIKLLLMLLVIVLSSISTNYIFVLAVGVGILLRLSMLDAKTILKVLKAGCIAVVFTMLILLPAVFMGNLYSLATITPKVFISICTVSIISHTAKWEELTGALKMFFLPDIFIFVLDTAIKYIYLLGEFSLNMLYAVKLRSIGTNEGKYASLSGVAGTLFVKSREMSNDVYEAMVCRGFTGVYKRHNKFKFTFTDLVYIMISALAIILFIYTGR